jgi:uracil-DNA glycosylase family 4
MSKQAYLKAMGINIWEERSPEKSPKISATKTISTKKIIPIADWSTLEKEIENCKACDLYKTRTNTVFGTGSKQADLMIIGEAPGADEDAQGKPFVGRAGQLLTQMLNAINISRDDVFITNILKSRPPNNREPAPDEIKACTPFLQRQINLIQPKLMVALGRVAARFLLNDADSSLGSLRTKIHHYGEQKTPLIITYHPAYLLRSPGQKAKSYEDLRKIRQFLKTNSICNKMTIIV